jgi:hypothetical protein
LLPILFCDILGRIRDTPSLIEMKAEGRSFR